MISLDTLKNAEEARAAIAALREKFELEDEAASLRDFIDIMEERHGEEFEAFFMCVMLRVLLATGLPEIRLDTNSILQSLAGKDSTGDWVEVTTTPGAIVYTLRSNSTNS